MSRSSRRVTMRPSRYRSASAADDQADSCRSRADAPSLRSPKTSLHTSTDSKILPSEDIVHGPTSHSQCFMLPWMERLTGWGLFRGVGKVELQPLLLTAIAI